MGKKKEKERKKTMLRKNMQKLKGMEDGVVVHFPQLFKYLLYTDFIFYFILMLFFLTEKYLFLFNLVNFVNNS